MPVPGPWFRLLLLIPGPLSSADGLFRSVALSDEKQADLDDARITTIDIGLRTKLVQKLYDSQTKEVQNIVDRFRKSFNTAIKDEADLLFSPMIILGGPIPSQDGKIACLL